MPDSLMIVMMIVAVMMFARYLPLLILVIFAIGFLS